LRGNGIFSKLGETWFDEYWINYGKIIVPDAITKSGSPRYITNIRDYLKFKGIDDAWIAENITSKMTTANFKAGEDE